MLKLTAALAGLLLAAWAGVALASTGQAKHRAPHPRKKLLGVTCVESHGRWAPATAAARRSRGEVAVCRYLAAPAGRVKLARGSIKHEGRVTCGRVSGTWVPGSALAGSYFISDKRHATDYADVAKRARGKLKRAAVAGEKRYRTRRSKGVATCSAITRSTTTTTTPTTATTPTPPGTTTPGVPVPGPGDWPTFGYDPAHDGDGPASTGITAQNVGSLQSSIVRLAQVADSAPIELSNVTVNGATHNAIIVTEDYGETQAIDASTGAILWSFNPPGAAGLPNGPQLTDATPVADPNRGFVYTASPDGYIHKLSISNGAQVWQTQVVLGPKTEKLDGAISYADGSVIVVTGGYDGDGPPYQGHVVTLNPITGQITHVFYTLCSNNTALINPSTCSQSDSGIWGRGGANIMPNGNILIATGNAFFDGITNWGDSVMELSPTLTLEQNWTPGNQSQLNTSDTDLGSTEPAILPDRGGVQYAVQGGKDGILRLINLNALDGKAGGPAGPTTGGELQSNIDSPGGTDVFSQPAVWTSPAGTTYVYVADADGTEALIFNSSNRLAQAWSSTAACASLPGTSPVVAGGLLYVYDESAGELDVCNPTTGALVTSLRAATGHWNSPIVVNGIIALPVGSNHNPGSNQELYIWRVP